MASLLSASDVLQLINNDEWGASDDEGEESEDDWCAPDPLDQAQQDMDLQSTMESVIAEEQVMDSESVPPSSNVSPTDAVASSHLSAATAFDPQPFNNPVGPTTVLDSDSTPLDFFTLVFDGIFELLVEQTNLYATQNPPSSRYKWHPTCVDELKLFLGMIIAMGIHQLPQLEDYWSSPSLQHLALQMACLLIASRYCYNVYTSTTIQQ